MSVYVVSCESNVTGLSFDGLFALYLFHGDDEHDDSDDNHGHDYAVPVMMVTIMTMMMMTDDDCCGGGGGGSGGGVGFFLACGDFGGKARRIISRLRYCKVEISSREPVPFLRPGSVHRG